MNAGTVELLELAFSATGVLVTALGLGFVIRQIHQAGQIDRREAARGYMREYFLQAMTHPDFAIPSKTGEPLVFDVSQTPPIGYFGAGTDAERRARFDRYEWFVALVMETFEHVYLSAPKDPSVRRSVHRALDDHATYLRSQYVFQEAWLWDDTPEFRAFIASTLAVQIPPEPSERRARSDR